MSAGVNVRSGAVAVLCDEVYNEIETTGIFCAKIVNKKETSELIKRINDLYPLPNLKHLKRARANGGELWIIVVEESCDVMRAELEAKDALSGLMDFHVVQVPKYTPITRAQYKAANTLWPTQFHENKRLEKILSGTLFTDEEISLMSQFMKLASEECNSRMATVGAVIVDPVIGCVVAKGSTCSSHPLKHAIMVCIDAVAVAQGGGAWSASVFQTSNPADEKKSVESAADPSVSSPKRRKPDQQYLCTGYDAYVTMEPCIMCAMALVHSRIGRVFYGSTNRLSGGLGSHFKIHVQTGLNHHFEVYRINDWCGSKMK